MIDFYGNHRCVYMNRTCGRGLHGLNSDDRRFRKRVRRFLSWYVERSERKPLPIQTALSVEGNLLTLVSGSYREEDGCLRDAEEVICKRGRNKSTELYPRFYKEHDIIRYGICFNGRDIFEYGDLHNYRRFQRDGIPNNYDDEARLYDDYCLSKNRESFAIKHGLKIDWTKTYRDEIIKDAMSFQKRIKAIRDFRKLPDDYKRFCRWHYDYFLESDYEYFCLLSVHDYHDKIKKDAVRECGTANNTSARNLCQLRALGFVA